MAIITTRDEGVRRVEHYQKTGVDDFMRWYEQPRGAKRPLWSRLADQAWKDEACFIVGGGPSLTGFDFERLRRVRGRVIACNKAFLFLPFADMLIAMDSDLYKWIVTKRLGKTREEQQAAFRAFREFSGLKVWIDMNNLVAGADVSYVHRSPTPEVKRTLKDGIYSGNNTGVGALSMALTLRCNPIFLLGFDCSHAGRRSHFHGGYSLRRQAESTARSFAPKFAKLAPEAKRIGIDVVNLNRRSALRCFKFGDMDKIIDQYTITNDAR